jgi:excisionase family DNA binding protein
MKVTHSRTATRHRQRNRPIAVTVRDAREVSGLGNTAIYALIKDGTLRTVKVGRRRLVLYDSIEELLQPA